MYTHCRHQHQTHAPARTRTYARADGDGVVDEDDLVLHLQDLFKRVFGDNLGPVQSWWDGNIFPGIPEDRRLQPLKKEKYWQVMHSLL
jgi:hypothetical protein